VLRFVHDAGFDGASVPVGVDGDGRERMVFVPGDVAIPPYPAWAQGDDALVSTARLLRRYHDAVAGFDLTGHTWSDELSDPVDGSIVCHNDVCWENVVFRNGEAVALLDFDWAAPGRPEFDVAAFIRLCLPIDDPVNATLLGWGPIDYARRLRLGCDAYGLDRDGRHLTLSLIADTVRDRGSFVRRRVEAGDANFIASWNRMGGQLRFDRRHEWFMAIEPELRRALN
jgi:aminoglycoside phosphotransferase (APT) family kinase protein